MPKGYNSLNDMKVDDRSLGICPVCNMRLTAECEHVMQDEESQMWLAAYIVAEQLNYNAKIKEQTEQAREHASDREWLGDPAEVLKYYGIEFAGKSEERLQWEREYLQKRKNARPLYEERK